MYAILHYFILLLRASMAERIIIIGEFFFQEHFIAALRTAENLH